MKTATFAIAAFLGFCPADHFQLGSPADHFQLGSPARSSFNEEGSKDSKQWSDTLDIHGFLDDTISCDDTKINSQSTDSSYNVAYIKQKSSPVSKQVESFL
jgi:hypothetical protein